MQKNNWNSIFIFGIKVLLFVIGIMFIVLFKDYTLHNVKQFDQKFNHLNERINTLIVKQNERGLDVQGVKNIILKYCKHVSVIDAMKYAEEIVKVSNSYEIVTPSLLTSLIMQESRFHPDTTSWAGAMGLTQMMPETFTWICREWNMNCTDTTVFDPIVSIRMAGWYLDWLHKNSKIAQQKTTGVLAYYNGGGRQAYRYLLYEKQMNGIKLDSLETFYVNKLSSETKNYVLKIMDRDSIYNKFIENQLPQG